MKIVSRNYFLENVNFFVDEIKKGKIFVYPTDTVYGFGCSIEFEESVLKIKKAKQRDEKPFSVVVPSLKWIKENCFIDSDKFLDKLPGKYTLICKVKNKENFEHVNFGLETLGVRIPDNWFCKILQREKIIFVSTSANISGEEPVRDLNELREEMKEYIDYFIDDGILDGKPSTIIDLISGEIRER
jgi:tRNA threonylcarbamoyl adenosine modification protein (Sua5/YciO/YrdC/YwlC family)